MPSGLAALYVYEAQIPPVAETKIEGLSASSMASVMTAV